MDFDTIELRHIELPMHQPFSTSTWTVEKRGVLILGAKEDGQWYYGECSPLPEPTYNHETYDTATHIIEDVIAPALQEAASIQDYHDRLDWMKGHRMAKAAGDFLLHHRRSLQDKTSLADLIGGSRQTELCGASIGIKDKEKIVDAIQDRLDDGYRRIKLKIRPGNDIGYLETVRDHFPDIEIMADANSAYSLEQADRLTELGRFNLTMIEQPLGHSDIVNHGILADRIETPICLDESIHSTADVNRAARVGACEIINLKPQRVGGLHGSKNIDAVCQDHEIDLWIGSVLESGIGMSFALVAASLGQVSYPGDIAPASRYFERDVLHDELPFEDGQIPVPDEPGLPSQVDRDVLEDLTVERRQL